MSSNDDPYLPEGAIRARFAVLFQSFFQSPLAHAGPQEVAFLIERLQARRGAQIVCCDRSIMAYGWGLTAENCAVNLIGSDDGHFDGVVWSLGELGIPPDAMLMKRLAGGLVPGGRLIVDAGEVQLVAGWAHFPSIETLMPLGVARSPAGRRLYTWLREEAL